MSNSVLNSKSKLSFLITFALFLLSIIPISLHAQTASKEDTTFTTADGSSATMSVTFTTADVPSNADITDVDIELDFTKVDDGGGETCGPPPVLGTGTTRVHSEIRLSVDSPTFTNVNLVQSGGVSYSGDALPDSAGDNIANVVFDDGAGSGVGATPEDGTFQPNGTLGDFVTGGVDDPLGTWTINVQDTFAGDPLCVSRAEVIVTYTAPGPQLQSFTSTTADDTYGPGSAINITATYDTNLGVGSTMEVELDNGATVTLSSISGMELSGTYTVDVTGSGEDTLDLTVNTINSQNTNDGFGNSNTSTTLPGAGNNIDDTSNIEVDTTAPIITEDTAVPPLAGSNPNFTFTTDEDGAVAFGGGCDSVTTNVTAGASPITVVLDSNGAGAPLADGPYSCTLVVTDDYGNASSVLNMSAFTVDTTAPTLAEVTPVTDPTNDATPSYTFSSDEAGTITATGGGCDTADTVVASGNNTVSLDSDGVGGNLADGTYGSCTITVEDAAGNASAPLSITSFEVDTQAPTINEVTPVPTPGNDQTPPYTFFSDEAGSIAFTGGCNSTTTAALDSVNTVLNFDSDGVGGNLADGTYNCTIEVTDAAGNTSNTINVTAFEVDTQAPILGEVTPVTTPTADNTPQYVFSSDEAGPTITYSGGCNSTTTAAVMGNNTIDFDADGAGTGLPDNTYNCSITVTDDAGNTSSTLNVTAFEVDTTAPTLSETTPVVDPTNDNTPSYTFNTDEAGTITYGGGCNSVTTAAVFGDNVIDLDSNGAGAPLADGTYNTCTVTVTDNVGNASAPLAITSFEVDTQAPTLAEVTPVTDPTNNQTPPYEFSSDEAGTISIGGAGCDSADTAAINGNTTINFDSDGAGGNLADGTYNCTVTVTDAAGNSSAALAASSFEIDTTGPTLTEVTAVTDPTNDNTPNYEFNSDEAGTIVVAGGCDSANTAAVVGNQTIVLDSDGLGGALADGTYNTCTVQATDALGNAGNVLAISSFEVDTQAPTLAEVTPVTDPTGDQTPPYEFSSDEDGTISIGGAGCDSADTSASNGNNTINFDADGAGGNLPDGTYNCTVTVTDDAGNASAALAASAFEVDTTPPVLTEVTPVTNPTNNNTPPYEFNSNEDGTLIITGGCDSTTGAVVAGNTTINFDIDGAGGPLPDTLYSCTLRVQDAVGNISAPLVASDFVVDTTGPTLTELTPVTDPTNDNTPDYEFNSDEAGTIAVAGGCDSANPTTIKGNQTITLDSDGVGGALPDGTYNTCTVQATDVLGNAGNVLAISSFEVDTQAPTLAEVTPVPTPDNDPTPAYTFSSDEAGTISFGGPCNSVDTAAINGNNPITLDSDGVGGDLPDSIYNTCTVTVTDAAGNASAALPISAFEVDTTPPVVTEVTPVPTPTNNTTPPYTFNTNEAGTIGIGGAGCDSPSDTTAATVGNNSITFDADGVGGPLADGLYDCTITVTDAAGNTNSPALMATQFEIDTIAPVLQSLTSTTSDDSYGPGSIINITATYDDDILGGNITVTLDTAATAIVNLNNASGMTLTGNYTVGVTGSGENSLDLTAVNIVTHAASDGANTQTSLVLPATNIADGSDIEVDTTEPMLAEVTPVTTPGNDATPAYTFSSDEAGTATYGGGCDSMDTAIVVGNNTVNLDSDGAGGNLADGTYASCTVTVTDPEGNVSSALAITSFEIDTTGPTIAEVTPVPTPTMNANPSYTFNSNDSGTIVLAGGCNSVTTAATAGNNTITLDSNGAGAPLGDSTYNCTLVVNDALGNPSNLVNITQFVVDTTAPTLAEVTPVTTPTNDATPAYTYSSDEAGTAVFGGGCLSPTTAVTAGNNTVNLDADGVGGDLADGTYNTCTITVTDTAGNTSAPLAITSFEVDTQAPTVAEVTPVTDPTNDATPAYTFNTTETGTFNFGGGCGSVAIGGPAGNNTVDLDSDGTGTDLPDGTYGLCTVSVTDAAGNTSNTVNITSFEVDTVAPTVTEVTPVATPTNDNTPEYVFNTNEGGAIAYAGGCTSASTTANVGNNIIDFSALADGTYNACTITVTDTAGNTSTALNVTTFEVDTTAPTLAEVTPVPTPGNDATPSYTFNSNEAGTIAVAGGCDSADTAAAGGNNTVTLDSNGAGGNLADGTYNACTLSVTDAAGNTSAALPITAFTIDTVAPTLAEVTPVPTPTMDSTPSYTYSSDEAGTASFAGGCLSADTAAVASNNTVTLDGDGVGGPLADGTYNACTVTVTDAAGNASTALSISTFEVDTTAPTLAEVTPVPTPTNDATPAYTYNSSEAGTAVFAGGCLSSSTTPTAGNNTVNLDSDGVGGALADGTYNTCTVTVTDAAGNASAALSISTFEVDTTAPTVTEVTAVASPTNDSTPSYEFNTTEAGATSYGGGCNSVTAAALAGNNTIDFDGDGAGGPLADGTYSSCTVSVTDAAGNTGQVSVTSFTVDTTAPVLAEIAPATTPTSDATPQYVFSSNEAGTAAFGGGCNSTTTTAIVGSNIINLDADGAGGDLADGTYAACTVTVTDAAGNPGMLNITSFTVDTAAPLLQSFTSTTPDGDYGPGSNINVTATYDENIGAGSQVVVILNNGEFVTLNTVAGMTLTGTYTVGAIGSGQDVTNLTVDSILFQDVDDLAITPNTLSSVGVPATNIDSASSINIDVILPVIAEVTAVTDPTNDNTPDYTFSSTEVGTIGYGGGCGSVAGVAAVGNNTVALDTDGTGTPFPDGGPYNCTVQVTDAAGNASNVVNATAFNVDTVTPTLLSFTSTTGDGDYGPGSNINVTATYDEPVIAGSTLDVDLDNGVNLVLTNAVQGTTLVGTYTVGATGSGEDFADIGVGVINSQTASDPAGNVQNGTALPAINIDDGSDINIDTTAPVIAEVTPVLTPTADQTPSYTFNADEVGTLAFTGGCNFSPFIFGAGNNTVDIDSDGAGGALADGTYNCTLQVTDFVGNVSNLLNITTFDIAAGLGDDDGDTINDITECPTGPFYNAANCADSDNDGTPDFQDTDSDNDGEDDQTEGIGDADGDGQPDRLENDNLDSDGDGTNDDQDGDDDNPADIIDDADGDDTSDECAGGGVPCPDADADTIPDYLDGDDTNAAGTGDGSGDTDGDGISDIEECGTGFICPDTDGDGIPDYADPDSDNDGITDAEEGNGDTDNDGTPDYRDTDSDDDGILDADEGNGDFDGDGTKDYLDTDADNDNVDDIDEGGADTDGDGKPDNKDIDSDNDGIIDNLDAVGAVGAAARRSLITTLALTDTDGDGIPNSKDVDSDGDGVTDNIEAQSITGYVAPTGIDSDGDGLDNAYDNNSGGSQLSPIDFDGDGTPDYLDTDTDGDSLLDVDEAHDQDGDLVPDLTPAGADTDNDGLDNGFDTVNGIGTTFVAPNPFWRNSSPFLCTDLSATIEAINSAANDMRDRRNRVLNLRKKARNACGVKAGNKRARKVRNQVLGIVDDLNEQTDELPREEETPCELGTCSTFDSTGQKEAVEAEFRALRRLLLKQIKGKCIRQAVKAVGRERKTIRSLFNDGLAATDEYPNAPLVCTIP